MSAEGEPISDQVEYRILVDKSRAEEFGIELGDLAMLYSGTVVMPEVKPPLPSVAKAESPVVPFRKNMATEIYEKSADKTMWVVTKKDLHNFAADRKFDGTLVSRVYNTIMRELSHKSCMQNSENTEYRANGTAVELADSDDSSLSASICGLRVDKIAQLEIELSHAAGIHGYSVRSKDLLKQFVQELFATEE